MKKTVLFLGILLWYHALPATHIAIIGCGYVGLTCCAVLAHQGNSITCIDTDSHKIELLTTATLPFYEPGLQERLFDVQTQSFVSYSTRMADAVAADIYYICVPTPINPDGSCNCSYLYQAYDTILKTIPSHTVKIVCIKSTVPPGTMDNLAARTPNHLLVDLVYNPEFMREGSALNDMQTRNPIVIGGESCDAIAQIKTVLQNALPTIKDVIITNWKTAELIKYSWNSFSALRITYVNELANICRTIGADITLVTRALGCSEKLLPTADLKPGPGYGGSCLPKDTRAFAQVLNNHGFLETLVHQTIRSNEQHKKQLLQAIETILSSRQDIKTVTLLGLAFKPNTDDIRNAIALDIIPLLTQYALSINAYDPKAMLHMYTQFPHVSYCATAYDAAKHSDLIIVLTEWDEFKALDLAHIAQICKTKHLIDTRNIFAPIDLKTFGFDYITMGSV